MALLSQALHLGYLLSPHSAFQGHAAHTARWLAMLSPNGSSDTCISDGVFHIPMPCFHGALPVYPKVLLHFSIMLHGAAQATGTYMDPPALSRGSRVEQHASGQRPSYIRPLSEDFPWSSGPDAICASSPHHDRGLRGPVPRRLGGSRSDRSCHQLNHTSHWAEGLLDLSVTSTSCSIIYQQPLCGSRYACLFA
jgi:hypothetical protein